MCDKRRNETKRDETRLGMKDTRRKGNDDAGEEEEEAEEGGRREGDEVEESVNQGNQGN